MPASRQLAALCAALLLSLVAGSATAQAPAGPLPRKAGAQPQHTPEKPQIRVKVDLVNAPVTVRDTSGELVFDLMQPDFRIFDNGVEQKIEHFDIGGDPLSVVILMETSSRIEPFLPALRKTGILFTQEVLGQNGEAAVLGVHGTVEPLLPFTSDADRIEKTISNLSLGTSGVRLYDALAEAVGLLRNRPASRRRVVVAMAEAVDTGS
jgi:VWFA-related protein